MVNLVLPQSNSEPEPEPKKVHKKRNLRQVIIYLFYLVLIALVLAGLWYAQTQGLFASLRTQTSSQSPVATESAGPDIGAPVEFKYQGTLEEIAAEALFIENGNIRLLKKDGTTSFLTTLAKGESLGVNSPTYSDPVFIDANTWAVRKCLQTAGGEIRCGFYLYDMASKLIATVVDRKVEAGDSYPFFGLVATSSDSNLIGFTVGLSKSGQSGLTDEIHIYDRGAKKDSLVLSVICKDAGGRGGGIDDGRKIQFSPDSTKLLYLNTYSNSCLSGEMETIYVFDAKTNTKLYSSGKGETKRFSQAAWIDSNRFYYKDSLRGTEILAFDLAKKESLQYLLEPGSWYRLTSFETQAIYAVLPSEVKKDSKPQSKIVKENKTATGPDYFLPDRFLSGKYILGELIGYCGGPCGGLFEFGSDGTAIFDLSSSKLYRVKGEKSVTGLIYDIRI